MAGPSSIVTLGEVQDYLQLDTLPPDGGVQLQMFIDAARVVVEDIVGPVVQTTFDEWHDGGSPYIATRFRPIVSVTSVTIYIGPTAYPLTQVPSPDQGTLWSYMFEPEGRITRRGPGGGTIAFPTGVDAIHVVYVAGRTSVPTNIKMGALEIIRHNWQMTQQAGRPSFAGAAGEDEIPVAAAFAIPNRVLEWLDAFKRHPSIA